MSWKKVKLGEILKKSKIPVDIEDDKEYMRITIRTKHQGVSIRDFVKGSKIGTKKQFILKADQFVLSKIDAMYGAFGIAPDEVDGAIITGNFWAYDYDKNMVSIEWLNHFTNSPVFYDLCRKASKGITHRKYLDEDFFLNYEVNLPDLNEQENIIVLINSKREKINSLENELTHQLTLISQLEQAILQEAVQGKLLKKSSSPELGEVSEGRRGQEIPKTHQKLKNLPHLKTFRKELRKKLTPAEAKLWSLLKGKQFEGRKFRRQFSVANYILDFYCPSEHLAIELDGHGHFESTQQEYDRERDLFLQHFGIKVLRFENKWVWDNPEGLLQVVKDNFGWKEKLLSISQPQADSSPNLGEQLEETGYELLKRIKAEKATLRQAQGKGKKEKPLPPIKPEEIPFEIPSTWVWCRLGEIMNVKSAKRIHAEDYRKEGVPFLRSGEIGTLGRGEKLKSQLYISKEKYEDIKTKFGIPKEGDILIACIGGSIGNTWVIDDREFYYKDGNLVLIESIPEVETNFLLTYLKSPFFWKNTILNATDSSYNALTIEKLKDAEFPLPPLSEQKRIVAEIDKQFAKTKQLKEMVIQNQQATEQLLKALLHQAFLPTGAAAQAGEVKEMQDANS